MSFLILLSQGLAVQGVLTFLAVNYERAKCSDEGDKLRTYTSTLQILVNAAVPEENG